MLVLDRATRGPEATIISRQNEIKHPPRKVDTAICRATNPRTRVVSPGILNSRQARLPEEELVMTYQGYNTPTTDRQKLERRLS
jgi:hypothetical protein